MSNKIELRKDTNLCSTEKTCAKPERRVDVQIMMNKFTKWSTWRTEWWVCLYLARNNANEQ